MRTRHQVLAVVLMLVTPVTLLHAHDLWLKPHRYQIEPEAALYLFQYVGHDLAIELILPIDKTYVRRFDLFTANGGTNLLEVIQNEAHANLTGYLNVKGPSMIVVEHDFLTTEFTEKEFRDYVAQEKFRDSDTLLRQVGAATPQRERYARFMKTLLRIGPSGEGAVPTQVLGQTFEIVPRRNPNELGPHDVLEVQLLLEGRPLANQRVEALAGDKDPPLSALEGCTDTNGIARFRLDRPGSWLIQTVYLRPCSGCQDAEWESFWASLTFKLD